MAKAVDFWLVNVSDKGFCKIYLHILAHQKELEKTMGKFKTVKHTEAGTTLSFEKTMVLTYLRPRKAILVSTMSANKQQLEQMLNHYIECDCEIGKAVDRHDTLDATLNALGVT